MTEKWIKGFENKYSVSSEGFVFSYTSGVRKQLSASKNRDGYLYVCLSLGHERKSRTYKVHRLVAEAFIENPIMKKTVNHKDCNKANNNITNLEWNTQQENMAHAFKNNLVPPLAHYYGELNPSAKLTENQMSQIMCLLFKRDAYAINQTDIAKMFGISFQYVSKIKLGASRKPHFHSGEEPYWTADKESRGMVGGHKFYE